jgi:hypothetical protein
MMMHGLELLAVFDTSHRLTCDVPRIVSDDTFLFLLDGK